MEKHKLSNAINTILFLFKEKTNERDSTLSKAIFLNKNINSRNIQANYPKAYSSRDKNSFHPSTIKTPTISSSKIEKKRKKNYTSSRWNNFSHFHHFIPLFSNYDTFSPSLLPRNALSVRFLNQRNTFHPRQRSPSSEWNPRARRRMTGWRTHEASPPRARRRPFIPVTRRVFKMSTGCASPTPFDTADSSSGLCWQPRWKAIRKLTGLTSFKRVAILALQTPFTQCVRYCALPYPSIARSTFSPPLSIIIKLNQRQ